MLNFLRKYFYPIFFIGLFLSTVLAWNLDNLFLLHILQNFFLIASLGMAWNLMAGLCGQYSFGHALYSGLGSYLTIFSLIHFPDYFLLSLPCILIIVALFCFLIFFLIIHFKIEHAYFTLLSISFLECGRLFFENASWFGKTNGFFAPSSPYQIFIQDHFLWIMFTLMMGIFIVSRFVFRSDTALEAGAIRDNKNAALSIGINPYKSPLLVMVLSCVLSALVGIVYSFYQKNLFPEDIFSQQRSMHIILSPIIGGVGYLSGPILGAAVFLILSEGTDWFIFDFLQIDMPGLKYVIFGFILLVTILKIPKGLMSLIKK
jgi:branched-chain amino acid transport system permease protein